MTSSLPTWIALTPVVLFWASVVCFGCRADTTGLNTLTLEQFTGLRQAGAELAVFDANGQDTREKYGVIPGAKLLSSYRDYGASELPANRSQRIVFYCHSPMCSAAAEAARRAVAWGYRDVWVMTDGIRAWTEAGLPVDRSVLASAG